MSEENIAVENETTEILENAEVSNEETQLNNPDASGSTESAEEGANDTGADQTVENQEEIPPVKKKKTLTERQAEINKKVAANYAAARKAAEAKQQNEVVLQQNQEVLRQINEAQGKMKKPAMDDFETEEEYETALEKHLTTKADLTARQNATNYQQQQNYQQQAAASKAKYDVVKAQEIAKNPNYQMNEATVGNTLRAFASPQNGEFLAHTITDSEHAAKLINYFGTHPEELQKVAQMHSVNAVKKIGQMEGKLSQTPVKKTTNAPRPVTPEGGGGGAPTDLANKSQTEYDRIMNEREYGIKS